MAEKIVTSVSFTCKNARCAEEARQGRGASL